MKTPFGVYNNTVRCYNAIAKLLLYLAGNACIKHKGESAKPCYYNLQIEDTQSTLDDSTDDSNFKYNLDKNGNAKIAWYSVNTDNSRKLIIRKFL